MATYREIHGKAVKSLSTDPTAETDAGQIWYNTSSDTFKSIVNIAAWSSSSSLTTAREGGGSLGIQTAALYVGGESPPVVDITEEYDGTGWSAGGTMNTTRYRSAGAGILTAGLIFGGYAGPPVPTGAKNSTESYNGTAWTSSPYNLNTARTNAGGAGTSTSALCFGGSTVIPGPGYYLNTTESFDGEGWTSENNLNTSRQGLVGAGASEPAVIAFGGYTSSPPTAETNATESWDGTNWTAVNNMNTGRYLLAGDGTQTAALAAGGITGPGTYKNSTETWDGTDWTAAPNMTTGRGVLGGAGTSTAFVVFGGASPLSAATEEFNSSSNIITAAAWASGGAMPAAYYGFSGSAGTLTAGIALGGKTPPGDQATILKYDGTSWTANPSNLNTARRSGASVGTQTATLLAGGVTGSTTFKNEAEEFNGSSAAAQTALPYSGSSNFGFGTQTAAVIAGGYAPPFPTLASTNVEYDGSSWTAATALPAARGLGGSAGQAQTTGLVWAGLSPSAVDTTLEYDGTNWTSGGTYLESKSNLQGFGDQTSAISGGGEPDVSTCAGYDGTAWSTRPSLPGTRKQAGSGGSSNTSGLMFGGETPPITDTTIEFTGETTAVNVKTLTQS